MPPGAVMAAAATGSSDTPDADLDEQLTLLQEVVNVHSNRALGRTAQQIADAILGFAHRRPHHRPRRRLPFVVR